MGDVPSAFWPPWSQGGRQALDGRQPRGKQEALPEEQELDGGSLLALFDAGAALPQASFAGGWRRPAPRFETSGSTSERLRTVFVHSGDKRIVHHAPNHHQSTPTGSFGEPEKWTSVLPYRTKGSGKQEQREAPSSTCTIVLVSQTGRLFRLVCKGVKRENTLELA